MSVKRSAAGIAVLLCALQAPAMSANFAIDNPADKIRNPAGKIYNPATEVNNPALHIYNPAARINDPNPLSPPTQPVVPEEVPPTRSAGQGKELSLPRSSPAVPHKNYRLTTVGAYIIAAKKAFTRDNYREFIAITEDALRRISAGTLRSSQKSKQILNRYQKFGYGLLGNGED